jgi:hypothetical protein
LGNILGDFSKTHPVALFATRFFGGATLLQLQTDVFLQAVRNKHRPIVPGNRAYAKEETQGCQIFLGTTYQNGQKYTIK